MGLYRLDQTTRTAGSIDNASPEWAQMTHDNLHRMDSDERRRLLARIIPDQMVTKLLLEYELIHLSPQTFSGSHKQLGDRMVYLANRYTWRAGGSQLESPTWNLMMGGDPTLRQEVAENEFWLTNTVADEEDESTRKFVNRMIGLFSMMAPEYDITAHYQYFQRDDVTQVVIRFVFPEETVVSVGL